MTDRLCDDCPPVGYPTDATWCELCPRRTAILDDGRAGHVLNPDARNAEPRRSSYPALDRLRQLAGFLRQMPEYRRTPWLRDDTPDELHSIANEIEQRCDELDVAITLLLGPENAPGIHHGQ